MANALGFIEITGVVAAMDALDIMCKAADVTLATWERKLGGRLVTLVVEGEVEAVRQSIEAATARALKKPVSVGVLPNPTSPRTITVTNPEPIFSVPTKVTFAALHIASAASIAATKPLVSTIPNASNAITISSLSFFIP